MKECGQSRLKAAPLSGRSRRQQQRGDVSDGEKLAGVGADRQVKGVFLLALRWPHSACFSKEAGPDRGFFF